MKVMFSEEMPVSRATLFAWSLAVMVLLAAAALFVGARPVHASTFTVTNTTDSSTGSLRRAILDANANSGVADTINFNIPTSEPNRNATTGVFTITPTSALPTITEQVTIDGYTQGDGTPADATDDATPNTQAVGNDARLLIELNGTSAGSDISGLRITASNSTIKGLVINRFNSYGVTIADGATGNKVEGNYIGTDALGTQALGNPFDGVRIYDASNNTVGGTQAGARNIISGNGQGVHIQGVTVANGSTGNEVMGNYIGTDASGTQDLANSYGVMIEGEGAADNTVGGTQAGAGNIISGNGYGVYIFGTTGNEVMGNYIGTDASGTQDPDLGNSILGVYISEAHNNTVGGTQAGAGNIISGNGQGGVRLDDSDFFPGPTTSNRILGNSIFENGDHGIDLKGDGVTANDSGDADTGPNNLQNFPVLTSASRFDASGSTTIDATLNSTPSTTFTVQFYSSPDADPSNHGEGKTYLGQKSDVTTDGGGNASFSFTTQENVAAGHFVTATATSPTNDSSEFSEVEQVVEGNDPPVNTVPGAQSTNEDSPLVFSGANGNQISISDPDAGSSPVNVMLQVEHGAILDGAPGQGWNFFDTITNINAVLDGMRFDPDANYNGTATLTITTDDDGNTGTGGAKTDTDTVNITVNAVNDAPSFTKGADQSVAEDAGAQSVANWATGISPGPANESAQTVNFDVTNDNNALFSAQPSVSSNGTLTFTPAANQSGTATVSVRIKDDGGAANGGDDTSAPQSFTITVTSVNDAPAATNNSYSVSEDQTLSVPDGPTDVLANDTDPEGNSLTATLVSGPASGTLNLNPNGSFTYTPNPNFFGTDSFTYKASDGTSESNTATVNLTVNRVNDAPSFTKGPNQIVQDKAGAQSVANWATNTSVGPPNEGAQSLQFILTSDNNALFTSTGRPAVSSNGTLSYTPAVNANGTANVEVVARDSGGTANGGDNTSDAQSFQITVNDATAPRVIGVTPVNLATGVAPASNVTATFSEAMNANTLTNPTTLRSNTFTLVRKNADGTTTRVAAVVTYNATTKKATLNPDSNLGLGATYIATVKTGAKDLVGNALDQNPNTTGNQAKTWRFTVRT